MSETSHAGLSWEQLGDLALTDCTYTYLTQKQRMDGRFTTAPAGARDRFRIDGTFAIHISSASNQTFQEHLWIEQDGHFVEWISDGETCTVTLDGSRSSGQVGLLPAIDMVHGDATWKVIRSPNSGFINNAIHAELLRDGESVAVFRVLPTKASFLARKVNDLLGRTTVNADAARIFVGLKDVGPDIMTPEAMGIAMALIFRTLVVNRVKHGMLMS